MKSAMHNRLEELEEENRRLRDQRDRLKGVIITYRSNRDTFARMSGRQMAKGFNPSVFHGTAQEFQTRLGHLVWVRDGGTS